MYTLLVFALCCALVAVVWAVVLVDSGMLLAPVQRWLREAWRRWWLLRHPVAAPGVLALSDREHEFYNEGHTLDEQWWWKPLWGCHKCVAGWFGLLGYLGLVWYAYRPDTLLAYWHAYSLWAHLLTVCASIYFSSLLAKAYQWSQE